MIFPSHVRRLSVFFAVFTVSSLPLNAQNSAKELIRQGDHLALQWKAEEALQYYLQAEKLRPDSVPLLLDIAKQYRHHSSSVSSEKEKKRLGVLALDYSLRAVNLKPKDADANLSVAISYGKLLPYLDKKTQVKSTWEMKRFLDESLRLDPNDDIAWHVLGRWHQVISDVKGLKRGLGGILYGDLPSTTPQEAVKCFKRAIELDPSKPRHYIELGRTYAQMDDKATARPLIEKGLAMPDVEHDDREIKQKGRETLKKL